MSENGAVWFWIWPGLVYAVTHSPELLIWEKKELRWSARKETDWHPSSVLFNTDVKLRKEQNEEIQAHIFCCQDVLATCPFQISMTGLENLNRVMAT